MTGVNTALVKRLVAINPSPIPIPKLSDAVIHIP